MLYFSNTHVMRLNNRALKWNTYGTRSLILMQVYSGVSIFRRRLKTRYYSYVLNSFIFKELCLCTLLFFQLQLKKYYQHRKSRKSVVVHIEGTRVPLYGAGSNLQVTNNVFQVPLTLEFALMSRGDVVGKLVRTRHRKRVSCPLVIDSTSNKPVVFKKNSCTYTWTKESMWFLIHIVKILFQIIQFL